MCDISVYNSHLKRFLAPVDTYVAVLKIDIEISAVLHVKYT